MTQQLIRLMQAETEALSAFNTSLGEERKAIKAGDFLALNEQIERKAGVLEMIAKLGAARNARLKTLEIRIGDDRQLRGERVDAAIEAGWKGLVFALDAAAEANELTGAMVNAHLEFTQGALHALRQRGATATVYGRDGRTAVQPLGVSLGRG